jgi:hypothetical protein
VRYIYQNYTCATQKFNADISATSEMLNPFKKLFEKNKSVTIATCIYACEADEHLLTKFYASPVAKWLIKDARFKLFEVFADANLPESVITGSRLTLNTEEAYSNLPEKTFRMIQFFSQRREFDYILKIDVTTLTSAMDDSVKTGGKALSITKLIELISGSEFLQDYNGYSLLSAKRAGAENWAVNKGIAIDYKKIFNSDLLPEFYSGKLWLISRDFFQFIANEGETTVDKFTHFFPAEDVMIGYLFDKFKRHVE